MKNLLFKLFFVPFIAFFAMMMTVAIMGSLYDTHQLKEVLGGHSGLPVWYVWLAIITPSVVIHHFFKK